MNSDNVINDGGIYTPEELAWKLIMDENIDNNVAIMAFADENSKETLFEILIIIYIEMLFNYYKMQYLENTLHIDEEEDEEEENIICDEFENFKLNLNNVNLELLTNVFTEKFKKIKYILNVNEISNGYYEYIKKNRYCTILLKDSEYDSTYFLINEDYLDPKKRYHFVLNSLYSAKTELSDIFCTVHINDKYYKVSFMSII